MTGEKPISYSTRKQRWELFGHLLRKERDIPATKAKGFKGKPRTTLPKVLNEHLNAHYNKYTITSEDNYCHRVVKVVKVRNQSKQQTRPRRTKKYCTR